jgi:hypothetical protein
MTGTAISTSKVQPEILGKEYKSLLIPLVELPEN